MPLKLTITDSKTEITYTDSIHTFVGITNFNPAENSVTLKIQVYENLAKLQGGAASLYLEDWGRNFYLIPCSGADFIALVDTPLSPSEIEQAASLTLRQLMKKRVEAYLRTLNVEKTGFCDYTEATLI